MSLRANVPVRPFPWTALDSLGRHDATRIRQIGRYVARFVDRDIFRRRLEEIAGHRIFVRLRSIGPARPGDPHALAVKLSFGDREIAVIEVEAALAAALVASALSPSSTTPRKSLPMPVPGREPSHEVSAALAAVIAHALRRSTATNAEPLRIRAFGGSRTVAPLGDPLRAESTWHALSFTVRLGDEAFVARLLVPRAETEQAPPASFDRASLIDLGELSLGVPIVAAVIAMTPSDLLALSVGDALIVDRKLAPPPCAGPVWLAGAQVESATNAAITDAGQLVLRGNDNDEPMESAMSASERDAAASETQNPSAGTGAGTATATESLLASLGDAPVVVRVEIGVAEMKAREWAELSPGDVVALGRRIGEPVILRVAGREVARGELVDLEGEVGVRIMRRGDEP